MLKKVFNFFSRRRSLLISKADESRIANLDSSEKVAELLWYEYVKIGPAYGRAIEKSKAHAAFHAGFAAGDEFRRCLK